MIGSENKPLLKLFTEILPLEQGDKKLIMLKDSEGISDKIVLLPFESIGILNLLNGENTVKDIQSYILKETGILISENEIINFISQLESYGFIENESLNEKRKKIYEEFVNSNVRKEFHKGLSYPDNIIELTSFMSKFYSPAGNNTEHETITGLIVPHIDLIRGGDVYALGYSMLHKSIKPDLIIALGVSHYGGNSPLIFTKKSYQTPYGNMDTDLDVYSKIKNILWYEPDEEEILHRREHSLEFQALWLKYIWRDEAPKWLPVLVTDFSRFADKFSPSKVNTVNELFIKLENLLKELSKDRKILILSGVDFSHVGPRFGDNTEITVSVKNEIENKDKQIMKYITELDYDGFYEQVISTGNLTHICGLSAVYSSLRLIKSLKPDSKGEILGYKQADDPLGGFVSFATIKFD